MKMELAPEKGILYALYKDRMEFHSYDRNNLEEDKLLNNLLELHLFDNEKEYRYVKGRNDVIETIVANDVVDYDDVYEEVILTDGYDIKKVKVVNYITYNENDLMQIENYRLEEVK